MFFKIALLNIIKHKKQSIVILVSVCISVIVMELVTGMFSGIKTNFFNNLLQDSGHIQVRPEGWEDRIDQHSLDYMISGPEEIIENELARDEISAAEPIMHFGGMVIKDEKNLTIAGDGILPDTVYYTDIREGIEQGDFLTGEGQILLSTSIAELMEIAVGDPVIVLVQDSSGSPFYMEFSLQGLFNSGSQETDNNYFYITYGDSQELLYLDNQANEIRINLSNPELAGEVSESLEEPLADEGADPVPWKEVHGSMIQMLNMADVGMLFVNILVIIVVATVITNSILMTIFERIREFGTLRAIGMKKYELFSLILTEGSILGVIGGIAGLAIAIPIVLYFSTYGLDIGQASEFIGSGRIYYFSWQAVSSLGNLFSGILVAVLGSTYAAWAATRKSPVESLRAI
ncbi:MAG: ABC transporter permease [Spirochaetia bacterium]